MVVEIYVPSKKRRKEIIFLRLEVCLSTICQLVDYSDSVAVLLQHQTLIIKFVYNFFSLRNNYEKETNGSRIYLDYKDEIVIRSKRSKSVNPIRRVDHVGIFSWRTAVLTSCKIRFLRKGPTFCR